MRYRACTVREYSVLKYSHNIKEVIDVAVDIADVKNAAELKKFITEYISEIENVKRSDPQLNIPYCPEENERKVYYSCNTQDIKIVYDYTGLNFNEIYEIDIFTFWSWLHDAAVWNLSKYESGRDYLERCYTHSQSEPDRGELRAKFGR